LRIFFKTWAKSLLAHRFGMQKQQNGHPARFIGTLAPLFDVE
jgi:hypothetical protein